MARPAEKARAMLNKWVAMREGESAPKPKRAKRPHLASECEHLADAERFRGQIVREITDKIAKIQSPALPENEVRDLNDEINRLQREKYHWNKRIYQLGGVDYNTIEKKRRIEEGDTQLHSIYRYYGVAKNLPGVKELLEQEAKARTKVKRSEVHRLITPDYFGWRDEEDGVLLELEEKASKSLKLHCKKHGLPYDGDNALGQKDDGDFLAPVHSQEEIAKLLLEKKKEALMKKYAL